MIKFEDIKEKPDETHKITEVKNYGDGWEIKMDDSFCFVVPKKYGVKPKVGDTARMFGGFGHVVRGIVINNDVVFYRTPVEQALEHKKWLIQEENREKKEFEKNKAKLDASFDKLPEVFQHRITKFRTNNPNFRWKYESYEMFVCEEAIKIASILKTDEEITKWKELTFDEQMKKVPISDQHSGNTFGMAVYLARLYLVQPENVVKLHGALAPLVGSKEYGCVPRSRGVRRKVK